MSRKDAIKIVRVAFTIALLVLILNSVGLAAVLETLRHADLGQMTLAATLFLFGTIVRSFRWWLLLRSASYEGSFRPILGLSITGEFVSTALPTGYAGDAVRVLELKVGKSRLTSLGLVLLDRLLGLTASMVMALIALAIGHALLPKPTAFILGVLSLAGFLAAVAVLQGELISRLMQLSKHLTALPLQSWLEPIRQAFEACPRPVIQASLALSFLNAFLTVGNHYLVALAVGIELGSGLFFVLTPIVNLSLLMPTISGLGMRELGYQVLLAPYGIPAQVAVALGLGIYLTRLLTALLGGAYALLQNLRS